MTRILKYKELSTADKIVRAKIKLGFEKPFFAYLLGHANIREFNEQETKDMKDTTPFTICADGDGNIIYNPEFIEKHIENEKQLMGLLAHEVFHIAFEHLPRLKRFDKNSRDGRAWNISADLVVNYSLLNDGLDLPKGDLVPNSVYEDFNLNGVQITDIIHKNVEQIYKEIREDVNNMKEQSIPNGFDEHKAGSDKTQDGKNGKGNQEPKDWKKILTESYTYAKQRGSELGAIGRAIEKMLNPELDWRSKLYKYITREIPSDYTYNRPSKKSIASGFYLPSPLKENLNVVVAVDTSGSITQKEYDAIIGELIGISKSFSSVNMNLLSWDTQVRSEYKFHNGDIEKIKNVKLSGGGGTDIRPVFEKIESDYSNTNLLIVITDGYFFEPYDLNKAPSNMIWVLTPNNTQKLLQHGEVVNMRID